MNQTIKIFLASSSELVDDRRAFEIFISRQNNILIEKGVYLKLVIWENFLDAISDTRLQEEYNKAIRECDLFVLLFFTKVGKYSAEEFKVAYDTFKTTGKPLIYTYFKDAQINIGAISPQIMSMLNFKQELSDMGHFYSSYQNTDGLLLHFSQQLDKLEEKGFIPNGESLKEELKAEEPTFKKGHVLYQIPKKMQMLKETTCKVRIAFDKVLLTQDFDMDQDTEVESGIRVSDYMEVNIIDPGENKAFQIRTNNELIQYVGLDAHTEWRFYVKPVLAGEHPLELKVSIIMMINGREVKREKSFDENIIIVAEPVSDEPQFVKAMDVNMLPPDKKTESSVSDQEISKKKKKSRGTKGPKASKIYIPRGGLEEKPDLAIDKVIGRGIDDLAGPDFKIGLDQSNIPDTEKIDLKAIKKRLKRLVAEDLGEALEELEKVLSDNSRHHNLFIGLKARYKRNRKEEAGDLISSDNAKREYNKILHSLQFLIDELQEKDIE